MSDLDIYDPRGKSSHVRYDDGRLAWNTHCNPPDDLVYNSKALPSKKTPAFTFGNNVTAKHLKDPKWLPPPCVLLDDACTFLVYNLVANGTSRGRYWPYNFDVDGDVRKERPKYGSGVVVHAVAGNGRQIGYFYLVWNRTYILDGQSGLYAELRACAARKRSQADRTPWSWGMISTRTSSSLIRNSLVMVRTTPNQHDQCAEIHREVQNNHWMQCMNRSKRWDKCVDARIAAMFKNNEYHVTTDSEYGNHSPEEPECQIDVEQSASDTIIVADPGHGSSAGGFRKRRLSTSSVSEGESSSRPFTGFRPINSIRHHRSESVVPYPASSSSTFQSGEIFITPNGSGEHITSLRVIGTDTSDISLTQQDLPTWQNLLNSVETFTPSLMSTPLDPLDASRIANLISNDTDSSISKQQSWVEQLESMRNSRKSEIDLCLQLQKEYRDVIDRIRKTTKTIQDMKGTQPLLQNFALTRDMAVNFDKAGQGLLAQFVCEMISYRMKQCSAQVIDPRSSSPDADILALDKIDNRCSASSPHFETAESNEDEGIVDLCSAL